MLTFNPQEILNKLSGWNAQDAFGILWIYFLPFVVLLPIVFIVFFCIKNKCEEIEQSLVPQTPINIKKKILIVDDSAVVRKKLNTLFGNTYEVLSASNGQEALDLMEQNIISVLITDLQMPIMDGFELISMVQGSLKTENVPIIAITAHEDLTAKVHKIQGIYGIFNKPWNDRDLLKRVDTLSHIITK